MDDVISGLSDQEMADLCAFADGSLSQTRREEVEARVAASPELAALVARQRRALAATQALAEEQASSALMASIERLRPRQKARWRRRLGLVLSAAGVLAVVAVVAVVLSVNGGPATPTVAAAAELALQPPSDPPPAVAAAGKLAASVGGVPFPDLQASLGWRAVGARRGKVGGRSATVVYYEHGGRRVGYAIVSGPALARPRDAATAMRSGVEFQTLALRGQQVVTWRSRGHTCVMAGPVSAAQLVELAGWGATGATTY